MTPNDFRRMALALPESSENSHMDHPDFRVGGKIFATLGYPDKDWGMLKLSPGQRDIFVHLQSSAFKLIKGGWGLRGATNVLLKSVKKANLHEALHLAWRNVASKRLIGEFSLKTLQ